MNKESNIVNLIHHKVLNSLNLKIEVEFNIETKEHHVINCTLYHGDKVWLYNETFTEMLMEEIETFTKDIDWYKIYLDDKYKYELENVNN